MLELTPMSKNNVRPKGSYNSPREWCKFQTRSDYKRFYAWLNCWAVPNKPGLYNIPKEELDYLKTKAKWIDG